MPNAAFYLRKCPLSELFTNQTGLVRNIQSSVGLDNIFLSKILLFMLLFILSSSFYLIIKFRILLNTLIIKLNQVITIINNDSLTHQIKEPNSIAFSVVKINIYIFFEPYFLSFFLKEIKP